MVIAVAVVMVVLMMVMVMEMVMVMVVVVVVVMVLVVATHPYCCTGVQRSVMRSLIPSLSFAVKSACARAFAWAVDEGKERKEEDR
jgi:uncharacterized FlgJ-related protein